MSKKPGQKSQALPACFHRAGSRTKSKPIWTASAENLKTDLKRLPQAQRSWVEANEWKAQAGSVLMLPGKEGDVAGAVLGLGDEGDPPRRTMLAGALPQALPNGNYHFKQAQRDPELTALAWASQASSETQKPR